MNNTPETDAFITSQDYSPTGHQWRNFTRKLERERDEAREDAAQLADRLSGLELRTTEELARLERERDETREEIENVKLQLGLWEDGNIICEETLGEIRLLKEQIDRVLLERNEAHKIAERAIDDLAWFNYSNAQRLRAELEQLKEGAK